jgi:hypothetical protein
MIAERTSLVLYGNDMPLTYSISDSSNASICAVLLQHQNFDCNGDRICTRISCISNSYWIGAFEDHRYAFSSPNPSILQLEAHGVMSDVVQPIPLPAVGTFCFPLNIPYYYYAFWIPTLVFESILCAMALFRGYQTYKSSGPLIQSGKYLVNILIRDSGLYFMW